MRVRIIAIWVWILTMLLTAGSGRAQESQPSEYQVKAAFIYNFAKLIEWPPAAFAQPTSPMIIGVLGQDPFGGDLERVIRGKTIESHPLTIKPVSTLSDTTNGCHILFVSASEKKRLPEILERVRSASVLTVAEMDGFTEAGGMINFVREGKKIRFQINNDAARSAGLKISSKLLSLALRPTR